MKAFNFEQYGVPIYFKDTQAYNVDTATTDTIYTRWEDGTRKEHIEKITLVSGLYTYGYAWGKWTNRAGLTYVAWLPYVQAGGFTQ